MIRHAVILVMILVVGSYADATSAQLLTVEEAIRVGLKNNYAIQIARNAAESAGKQRALGRAEFMPTVDANAGYNLSSEDVETNSPFSFGNSDTENWSASAALNWTVFDGFRMFAERSRYENLARLGETQARQTIENAVVAIMRAYFNVVQQEQLLHVFRQSRDISKTRLEKEELRSELGGASSTDLLNARVAFNADQAAFLTQQLQVTIARENLNTLLGRDPGVDFEVTPEFEVPALERDADQILRQAEHRNTALAAAAYQKAIAEKQVTTASSRFLPKVSLNASASYADRTVASDREDFTNDITTQTTNYGLGLQLSLNVFNGFRDGVAVQQARIEANNRTLALRDAHNQLAGQVSQAIKTFRQRLELVELETQNVEAAQRNLELMQDRYRLGSATSLEFRDAQVSLNRALNALIVARYQARISRLELDRLTGDIRIEH
jgi:outer membrane protein